MPRHITLNTMQGIGDLFWVYQKVAPYVDRITFNILCTNPDSIIQQRSRKFGMMLPKVDRVMFTKVRAIEYNRVADGMYRINTITHAQEGGVVDYACNAPLERGVRLEQIDPAAEVQWTVPLVGVPNETPSDDYLCVFVAGGKVASTWCPREWIAPIDRLAQRLNVTKVTLIGASWDVQVQAEVETHLRLRHYTVVNRTGGAALAATVGLIRRAKYFIGYQSGLNVLAENYNVRQFMVYFNKLRAMQSTWVKPDGIGTRFHSCCFGDDAIAAIDAVPV